MDIIDPATQQTALGGYVSSTGSRTPSGDSGVHWIRADFLRRLSVMTYGFVDLYNPNRCRDPQNHNITDPRLVGFPTAKRLRYVDLICHRMPEDQPSEARVECQLRSAEVVVDPKALLHPLAACESHLHAGWFTGVSAYCDTASHLLDPARLRTPGGTPLNPDRIRCLNWRVIFTNDVTRATPVAPAIDSVALVYRLE